MKLIAYITIGVMFVCVLQYLPQTIKEIKELFKDE